MRSSVRGEAVVWEAASSPDRVRDDPRRQFEEDRVPATVRGLERAWDMTERLEIFLSGCQLGITICSVGLGVVAEPALTQSWTPAHAVGVTGVGHTTLSVLVAPVVVI